jgi:phosphomethylpyrimidine synthase
MKISQEVRKFASEQEEAKKIEEGMEEMSEKFKEQGSELYV